MAVSFVPQSDMHESCEYIFVTLQKQKTAETIKKLWGLVTLLAGFKSSEHLAYQRFTRKKATRQPPIFLFFGK